MDFLNETLLLLMPHRPEAEMERFFAEKALRKNPNILESVLSFEKVVYALNMLKPSFEDFEPLPLICYARACKLLFESLPSWKPNSEIQRYLAYIAADEGWVRMPKQLQFAEGELELLRKHENLDEEQTKLQELKHIAARKYVEEGDKDVA